MTINFSQRELCEYFGWDYRQVAKEAKLKGMSTHAYVEQQTGWILKRERYYPPFNHSSTIEPNHTFNN